MPISSVSIVVPAYHCATTIGKAIQAILNQTFMGHIECIVVDDGSVDDTAKIIKSFSKVKYVYQHNAGPASARNKGAAMALGEIIFFTDSDCVPHSDWVEKMASHFAEPKVAVVSGSYGIANPNSLLAQCIHKEIIFRHQRLMPDYPKSFGSYNFCLRKKVFEEIGGFNTSYRYASGEDNDLSYKILKRGYKIYFERSALVDHHHTEHLGKYLKEQWRHGYWRVKMYQDHPQMWTGDDYTFFKDILEVPLACATFLWPVGTFLPLMSTMVFGSILMLIFLQILYGFIMMKSFLLGVFFSAVTFLRAYVRALGFFTGLLLFSVPSPKKFK